MSKFDHQFEILKNEINNIQSAIRNYDSLLLVVKGWAITIFSGFLYFAVDKGKPEFVLYSIFASALFWTLDSAFKSFQARLILRCNMIEQYLNSDKFSDDIERNETKEIQVTDTFAEGVLEGKYGKVLLLLKVARYPHQFLLYVVLIIMAIIFFFAS